MLVSLIARSPRTATILVAPKKTAYRLSDALNFEVASKDGSSRTEGISKTAIVHLTGLTPQTDYRFKCRHGVLEFQTIACGGLVNAREFGIDQSSENNAPGLQEAINAVPAGGTLMIPPGTYVSGPLFLRSDMTLHLEKGAEIRAISDWAEWPILAAHDDGGQVIGTWEGLPEASFAALLNAINCSDITITGEGIIDGGGDRGDWWSWPKETRRDARRPRTIFLAHCTGVQLSGLTVRNSPSWTIHPFMCRDLTATALKIENPPDSPNTDGFNPESCQDVSLTGLHFSVGDDCIAIKSGKRDGSIEAHLAPTRNISVAHCLMERGHGAVVLGSEMSGDITDIHISDCEFVGTDRGLRVKTRRGRGGRVANISMENVTMDKVATAISANAFYFCDADGKSEAVQSRKSAHVDASTPAVEGIRIRNVQASNVQLAAVALLGLPEAPITGIQIDNMHVTFDPEAEPDVPLMACEVPPCRHERLWAQFASVDGEITDATRKPVC